MTSLRPIFINTGEVPQQSAAPRAKNSPFASVPLDTYVFPVPDLPVVPMRTMPPIMSKIARTRGMVTGSLRRKMAPREAKSILHVRTGTARVAPMSRMLV